MDILGIKLLHENKEIQFLGIPQPNVNEKNVFFLNIFTDSQPCVIVSVIAVGI